MSSFWSKERIIAPEGFNRWLIPPASVAIHLCIGSVYAWSAFNLALTRVRGVVVPAAGDWSLTQVVSVFSVAILVLGLSAAVAGAWMEKVGPRTVGIVATICWGAGFLIGSLGILWHQLWLLYLGYGCVGGCGLGLGYVSPVSTLVRWFPDRRGMATGMAIMGFGGGAALGVPLKEHLIRHFYEAPKYLGAVHEVDLSTSSQGVRFAQVAGREIEVVVVGPNDQAGMLQPAATGVYVVGTGRTGVAEAFVALGLGYALLMLAAAVSYRIPAPGWKPAGWQPSDERASAGKMISTHSVAINEAMKTPQFWLLWVVLCFNVTAGIGILGTAKTMMSEIFGAPLSATVTFGFTSTYAQMTSVFNMLGRFFWASLSDYLGRKRVYTIFFVAGVALYLLLPLTAAGVARAPSHAWLVLFYVATMLIFTMYGGGFATIPAYLADLFGTKFVGGIHGRLLTAWSTAGILGPLLLTSLRERARLAAIRRLAAQVQPEDFETAFGSPLSQLDSLVSQNTVTIANLMELAPSGTVNPTSMLYNSTMYVMAGLLVLALLANWLIRPVDSRHHLRE
jgi:MFS family permease